MILKAVRVTIMLLWVFLGLKILVSGKIIALDSIQQFPSLAQDVVEVPTNGISSASSNNSTNGIVLMEQISKINSAFVLDVNKTLDGSLYLFSSDDSLLAKNGSSFTESLGQSSYNMASKSVFQKQHLFSSFAFKGIVFSIAKMTSDWTSMAMGFRIPLTPNFPIYDSKIYLPKVNAFVGVGLPMSVRLSITASIPTQAIVGGVLLLYHITQNTPHKWPAIKPTGSIKRLALTFSFRLGGTEGRRPTLGLMFMFLPGLQIVRKLLPFMLLTPTLVLSMVQTAQMIQDLIDYAIDYLLTYLKELFTSPKSASAKNQQPFILASSSDQLEIHAGGYSDDASQLHSPNKREKTWRPFSFVQAWNDVSKWMATKTPSFTYNFIRNYCFGCGTSTLSSFQFDIQPFFPFQNYFKEQSKRTRIRIKQKSSDAAKDTAAPTSLQMTPADSIPVL